MIVRFIGDAIGYTLVLPFKHLPLHPGPQWTEAYVGRSTRKVWIDVSKAYLIEEDA